MIYNQCKKLKINLKNLKLIFIGGTFLLFYNSSVYAQFLLPQDAFKFSAKRLSSGIEVKFKIAKGYLLYKEKFEFFIDDANVKIASPIFPLAKNKFDYNFKKDVEYYSSSVNIFLPIIKANDSFVLKVIAQGCAEKGICYPPTAYYYHVNLNNKNFSSSLPPSNKPTNFLQKSTNGNAFSFLPSQSYKKAGLETVPLQNTFNDIPLQKNNIVSENKKKSSSQELDKQDHSKFYWLFIFMCIICTAIISHPSFNQPD